VSLCKGDYIQWLDADDLIAPDKIERQMHAAQVAGTKKILFSCPWGSFIYRVSKARFIPTALWSDLLPVEWILRQMEGNLFLANSSWLVSRELTEAAGIWDTRLSLDDDGSIFLELFFRANRYALSKRQERTIARVGIR